MFDHPPQEHVYYTDTFLHRTTLAAITKLNPPIKANATYQELPCSETDRAIIYEIITTMAENTKFNLLLQQSRMKQLGAEINHVHPLRFLGTIFSNPKLKKSMKEISSDYFKWNGFLGGLMPNLTKEADRNKLEPFAAEFAKEVNIAPEEALRYFRSRKWESFVNFLMDR